MLTVAELIDALHKFPKDVKIMIDITGDCPRFEEVDDVSWSPVLGCVKIISDGIDNK